MKKLIQKTNITLAFNKLLGLKRVSIETLLVLSFIFIVLATSIGIVYVRHLERQQVSRINHIQQQNNALRLEYGQLLLELSTWASSHRIESLAKRLYNMNYPAGRAIKMVRL